MSATLTLWPGSETEHPLGICAWLWWRGLFAFKFLLTQDYPQKCGWEAPGTQCCWSQRLLKGNMYWVLFFLEQVLWCLGNGWGNIRGMQNSFTHDSFSSGVEKTCETPSNMFTHIKQGMFPPTKSIRTEMRVYANGKWSKPRSLVSLCQSLFQLSLLGKVHQTGIAVTWDSKCLTSLVLARTYRERGREHKSWLPPLPFHTIHNNP